MTFATPNRSRSGNRRSHTLSAPAQIETMESRLLLTAPTVLAPTGTIATGTPQIVWSAVQNPVDNSDPVSYDLWVSSRETFSTVLVKSGETAVPFNFYTPADGEELPVGDIRVWVRANFSDDTQSAWSRGHDFRIEVTPTVTGPTGVGPRNVILDSTPTITWQTPPGASSFQVFIRDDTAVQGRMYNVENTTGDLQEFTVPDEDALQFGAYTAWVRTIYPTERVLDQPSTRFSEWSAPFRFDYGQSVELLGPFGSAFDTSPVIRWNAVPRATNYEVFVINQAGHEAGGRPLVRRTVSGTSLQLNELPDDTYLYWVRAVIVAEGKPTVYGAWGSGSEFITPVQAPVVSIPSAMERTGQNPLVTSANPIVEWTAIDDAARYEIWINRSNSRQPFIRETSSMTSHKLEASLPKGTYYMWVRGVSTRGDFGPWSDVTAFDSTGGQPLVLSPTAGQVIDGFETTITWTAVEGAESYDLWVDYRDVDFTFIVENGLTGTSYTSPSPLDPGDYRVWVRAIFADGSASVWSPAVQFEVGVLAARESNASAPALTRVDTAIVAAQRPVEAKRTPVEAPEADPQPARVVAEATPDTERPDAVPHETNPAPQAEAHVVATEAQPPLPEELLVRLAAECTTGTWWDMSGV
ncbi:MAG: hypothetical protein R3C19_25965 [Planctomycetaceae bacterium]